jgi:hypothetical protein
MDEQITFTYEELVELARSGKFKPEHVKMLPRSMQGPGIRAINEANFGPMPMVGPGGPGGAAMKGFGGLVKETGKVLLPTGVQAVATATGHPWMGMTLAHGLSRLMGRGGGPVGAPKAPSSPPSEFTGTAYRPGSAPAGNVGANQTGVGWSMPGKAAPPTPAAPNLPNFSPETFPTAARSAPSLPGFGGEVKPPDTRPFPKNVERYDPRTGGDPSGVSAGRSSGKYEAEQVKGGVQNDFRGRVSFEGRSSAPSIKSEFPRGASNKTPPAEFKRLLDEMAEESYAGANPEVEAIRKFLRTQLRKPK